VLLFEFFPAILAVVVVIVGVTLFAINQRARRDPDNQEAPRTPSQPPVSPDAAATNASNTSRRPSMRA